jgi:hypothetical protein
MPQLIRREGDDLHVLPHQHHRIHRNSDRPAAKAKEATEIDHHQNLALALAYEFADMSEQVLAFDGEKNVSAQKIADPHGLREAHRGGLSQAHARWGCMPPGVVLCARAAPARMTSAPQMLLIRTGLMLLIFPRTTKSLAIPSSRPYTYS